MSRLHNIPGAELEQLTVHELITELAEDNRKLNGKRGTTIFTVPDIRVDGRYYRMVVTMERV